MQGEKLLSGKDWARLQKQMEAAEVWVAHGRLSQPPELKKVRRTDKKVGNSLEAEVEILDHHDAALWGQGAVLVMRATFRTGSTSRQNFRTVAEAKKQFGGREET